MNRPYPDWLQGTPKKRFDFSSPAAVSTPMSPGTAERPEHETPEKTPFTFGAGAMASSPQGY